MTEREAFEAWCEREKISFAPWNGIRIVAQAAWEAAWKAARAQPAQAVSLLTDAEVGELLDAARVPELPNGYENLDMQIARAVEHAVRAKLLGKEGGNVLE